MNRWEALVALFRCGWLDPDRLLAEHVGDASGLCRGCRAHGRRTRCPCPPAWCAYEARYPDTPHPGVPMLEVGEVGWWDHAEELRAHQLRASGERR